MTLLLLQYGSLIMTMLLALMLIVSRIHINRINTQYETSRWMLCTGMLILAVHYALQILFGFRAQGDDVGAVINILFYAPTSYLVSYSTMNFSCTGKYRRRFLIAGSINYCLIVLTFIAGVISYKSLHMKHAMYFMAFLYVACILYSVIYPLKEYSRMKNRIESETAGDLTTYKLFIRSGSSILYLMSITTTFIIFSVKLLTFIGPLFLLSLFIYIISFVCLGFNLVQVADVMNTDDGVVIDENATNVQESTEGVENANRNKGILSEEELGTIESAIEVWMIEKGFRDSSISIASMSRRIGVSHNRLSEYISQQYGVTFRVWLSRIRMEEAKQLLEAYPEYSNEVVAEECGFTSRNYFQNMFKAETGYTPKEWKMLKLKG